MEVYFHSDRADALRPGMTIEPEPYRLEESRLMLLRPCMNGEFGRHLAELMQEGISLHGAHYLMTDKHRPDFDSIAIELVYEAYRWRNAQAAPSRLQSLFAWRSLEDAVRFGRERGGGHIYRVRCHDSERPMPHDMNGLRLSFDAQEQERYAGLYWMGKPFASEATYQPRWEYLLRLPVTVVEEVRVNPLTLT